MSRGERRADDLPDVAIGATVRARRLRFRKKPKTKVELEARTRFRPDLEVDEVKGETDSHSERKNLPEEVEPGVTYRNVEVGWVAGARAVLPDEHEEEGEEEGEEE
jgi:hypothetical protein